MIPVQSSQINAIWYNEDLKELTVDFTYWNANYCYHDVSPEEYQGLMLADSLWKYFNAYIKNIKRFEKLW